MSNDPNPTLETADLPRLRRVDLRPGPRKSTINVRIRLDAGPTSAAWSMDLGAWDAAQAYELAEAMKDAIESDSDPELVAVLPMILSAQTSTGFQIDPIPCVVARALARAFASGLAVEAAHAMAGRVRPGQTIWEEGGTVNRIAVHTTEDPTDDSEN